MLRSILDLEGYEVHALDGAVGKIQTCLFDDRQWSVRHFVVHTGDWAASRDVVLAPVSIGGIDDVHRILRVSLTREQLRKSPQVNASRSLSREAEKEVFDYYRWPYYWTDAGMLGIAPNEQELYGQPNHDLPGARAVAPANLRSTDLLLGSRVECIDTGCGRITDLFLDDSGWAIRYLVIDARSWWPGRATVIPPDWVEGFDWDERRLRIPLSQDAIRTSPEYRNELPTREFEEKLYAHYSRQRYWGDERRAG